jgi:hypothetical protein
MARSLPKWAWWLVAALAVAPAHAQGQRNRRPQPLPTTRPDAAAALRELLADELLYADRELAGWMIRRNMGGLDAKQREHLELGIDLRVIWRTILAGATEAAPFTNEQALLWHRARQVHAAMRGLEDALAQSPPGGPNLAQKASMAMARKLSFEITGAKEGGGAATPTTQSRKSIATANLDEFCRNLAIAMVNCVNTTPIDGKALPVMRPQAQRKQEVSPKERPLSVSELAEQVQHLAALSIPLRQHLLALVKDASEEKAPGPAYQMLSQAVTLARGVQGNTAVTAEQRAAIELQVTEGLAMFMDPRTKDAGRSRIDSLAQYRQLLTRLTKLSLSREQMAQLSPALTWAQTAGEPGQKFMASLERYFEICGDWDALPAGQNAAVPPLLRRAHEEMVSHFTRERQAVWSEAMKVGTGTAVGSQIVASDIEPHLAEMARVRAVADDLLAMNKSFDTLNAYKPRPAGGLERRAQTAATAAASATPSVLRSDGEQYLKAVRRLAELAQKLSAVTLSDIPPGVAQGWAAAKVELFEARWKGLVTDLASSLASAAVDLDKPKALRLETAAAMAEALRSAASLEDNLKKAPLLSRWADWGTDPSSLHVVFAPYKEALAAAFTAFASDSPEAVERWHKAHGRYAPLVALINRDAAYAEQCERMPIGFAGDVARLATKMDGAPFGTERFATYAVSAWAAFESAGDETAADRTAVALARRLAKELDLEITPDEAPLPRRKKAKE